MAELTIDLTYGNALFMAAKELDKTAVIAEESKALLSVFEQEPDLRALLDTPAISAYEKKAVMAAIFEGQVCDELLNFLYVLIDKGRTRHLAKIIKMYDDMLLKAEGVSYGEVLSVEPLAKERLAKCEAEVGKLLKSKVKLENKQDAGLIGGIKVYVDGKVIDASVQGRLRDLRSSVGQ